MTSPREPAQGRTPIPGRWADRGACRGWPTEWWYPGGDSLYPTRSRRQQEEDAALARRICRDLCPVAAQCLAHAVRYREAGIWAALDQFERQGLSRKRRKVSA